MSASVHNAREFAAIVEKIARDFHGENRTALAKGKCGIVGIHTRGVFLAQRIARILTRLSRKSVPVGSLDITLYRDDVGEIGSQPLVKETDIPFPIAGRTILLVDDVLYTGRTTRAALDALMDFGRPRAVQLAVLIDRGLRELPIQADYVGMTVATTPAESVKVLLAEAGCVDQVVVRERAAPGKEPA